MNAGPDVLRLISDWLDAEAPARAPDRILTSSALVIDHTKQRRAWRVPWRIPQMNPMIRFAGIAVLAVLALGAALYMSRPASNVGAGPPAPTPSATACLTLSLPGGAGPSDAPIVPQCPLPSPSGDALSADMIGRTYAVNPPETSSGRQLVLTLRGANDPHCAAMYDGSSTCFTVLWVPFKSGDPGARGPARLVAGNLVLGFAIVPFDTNCVGSSATYAIEDAGATLRGIAPPACTFPAFSELR